MKRRTGLEARRDPLRRYPLRRYPLRSCSTSVCRAQVLVGGSSSAAGTG